MKKLLSLLSIALLLNNIFVFSVFAGLQLSMQVLQIRVNDGVNYASDVEVNPGDKLSVLMSGQNKGDPITNPRFEMSFSKNNFTYSNSALRTLVKSQVVKSTVPLSDFNPSSDNSLPIADSAGTNDYLDALYVNLTLNQDISENSFTIFAKLNGDGVSSNQLSRNVFVNTNPHIVDYYFENTGTTTTQIARAGTDTIDFFIKVKDYNGCNNIDNASVTANLSKLGLGINEILFYQSCSNNTAIYKKTGITTLVFPSTISFAYSDFSVFDEDGNINKPNDSQTSFDDEDKKTSLNLEIVSAGTPELAVINNDEVIGGTTNQESTLNINGNQNGEYKVVSGTDGLCDSGNTIIDWTSYSGSTDQTLTINSSSLNEGDNNIFVCLKNDEDLIGSFNTNITKDITSPEISTVSVGPTNVVIEDTITHFTCSEDGTYRVEKSGSGIINAGTLISEGPVVANSLNDVVVSNSELDVLDTDLYLYCIDEAENTTFDNVSVYKTTPPPAFDTGILSFSDLDFDYDGLDGRDISITWDTTLGENYDFFEAYKVYILPFGSTLDYNSHNYLSYIPDNTTNSFTGELNLTNDSVGNPFISGNNYTACVNIIGINGYNSSSGCLSSILTGDIVNHATILSAEFTTDTTLKIFTDTILDTDTLNHDVSKINFEIDGNSITGSSILSIDGKNILIGIPSLGGTDISGTDLEVLEGAIRSHGGGFNFEQTLGEITDGQSPEISNFSITTTPLFGNFYNGNFSLDYTFSEEMRNSVTYFEILRTSGNLDSEEHNEFILQDDLHKGTHTKTFDLDSLGLVDGTIYQMRIVGDDLFGNYGNSQTIFNIGYDKSGADKIVQNVTALYSDSTPELTWEIPLDNNGNGSGIASYQISVYTGNDCTGTLNHTLNSNTNSVDTNELINIADYSWTINSTDNVGNVGTISECSNFRVDTTVPLFENFEIKDTVLDSTEYLREGNPLEVSSSIEGTDIDHIWADLSMLTGTGANNNESCSTPSVGISCTYIGNIVTYSLNVVSPLSDGTKQVMFTSQNTSGGNDVNQIVSSTADSNNPTLANDTITGPTGLIGGTGSTITWTPSKITDTIGLDHIEIEYSTGAGIWSSIGSGDNNGSMIWDLSGIPSGTDYKVRIIAFDGAGNSDFVESGIFEVDTTNPTVPTNTIINPNGGEIFGSVGTELITWASGSILDDNLKANPIDLYYSLDSGFSWVLIDENLSNSGSYLWTHGDLDSTNTLIKLIAIDNVGNSSEDTSDSEFIIDTTLPVLAFDFAGTPVDGSYINNSSFDISGNTSDLHLSEVLYSFQNTNSLEYFNGSVFTGSTEIFNNVCTDPVNNGTNSLCNVINFNLLSSINNQDDYSLVLKTVDEAGNETQTTPVNYIGDTIIPNITNSTASGTYFKDSILIEGSSSDLGSGISSVKIQIKQGSDYWDGSSFVGSIQTLNTDTTNNYTDWSYNFSYNGSDGDYEVTSIAYDKSYKVNNTNSGTITVIKDVTIPAISGGTSLFTSPLLDDIYIGGENISIEWGSGSISDSGAGLTNTPITLEYLDGSNWELISDNESNDGLFTWTSELLDSNNVKIRLSAIDNVGNIAYQNTESFVIDSTPPSIDSVETMDLDADGQIDALNVIMSEDIQDSSIVLSDFSISDSIGEPTSFETAGFVNDNNFILRFSNTGDTSTTPSLSYTKGNLIDIAGKFAETDNYTLSIDRASPRLLNTEIFDTDSNGKFDLIVSDFSENLNYTTDTTAWDIVNSLAGVSINSVSRSGNSVNIYLNEGDDFITSVGSMSLDFTSNSNWQDLNGNQAGSIVSGLINDKAKPVIYSAEYFDINSNYKVDRVVLNLSEDSIGFNDTDFSISGLVKDSGNLLGDIITFDITETLSDNDTGVNAYFNFVNGNLKDSFDNFANQVNNYSIEDKVVPKLLSIETDDDNGNGKIDNIILTYSEDINSDFSTLVGSVDSYNILSYSKGLDTELIMEVDEKEFHDSGDTPLVNIVSNNSLTDLNNNTVEIFSFTNSTDGVGPVIVGARYDESTHKVFIASSESINSSTYQGINFTLTNAGSYSVVSTDFTEQSITLTGESISFGSTSISFIGDTIEDINGNKQIGTEYVKLSPPIIINEIMLSDNSVNNYIELRNLSTSGVDISGYSIAGVTVPGGSTIPGNGLYLIAKDTEVNSILNITPDLIGNSLDISGTQLILNNGLIDIDFASLLTGLFDTSTPISVERKENVTDGLIASSWYTAQDSIGFDDNIPFGTPGSANIYDPISPIITNYTPNDNILLPTGNLNISYVYADNPGGIGIDLNSDTLSLSKWNGTSWGGDISSTYVDFGSKVITSTDAEFPVNSLPFGKYRINFSISDKAGNTTNSTIIFYVDEFGFSLNTNSIDIGDLISGNNTFSTNELILTVETVGAGFDIDMLKTGFLSDNGTNIVDFDGSNGFGYDQFNAGYSGDITSMGNNVNIVSETENINLDGEKNTYTYRIKYGANISVIQGAGHYSTSPWFEINSNY